MKRAKFPRKERNALQKLFSAFPGGWRALGLLLLRVLVGITVIAQVLTYVESWLAVVAVIIVASFLLIGFMTPIAAVAIGLTSVGVVIYTQNLSQIVLNLIVLTTVIVSLGPGAFSIDARMFGRREILIPHTPRLPK